MLLSWKCTFEPSFALTFCKKCAILYISKKTPAKGATAHDRSGEPIVGTMEGGGGGECSGKHIIEVDELPEVGVEGAIYSINKFLDRISIVCVYDFTW